MQYNFMNLVWLIEVAYATIDLTMISGKRLYFGQNPANVGDLKRMIEEQEKIPMGMMKIIDEVREMPDVELLDDATNYQLSMGLIHLPDPHSALWEYTVYGQVTLVKHALQSGAIVDAEYKFG